MTFFSAFYRTLVSSISDPSAYGRRGETFWKGFRYLYLLCVLCSFIVGLKTVGLIASVLPKVDGFLEASRTALNEAYPEELRLTFQSGAMSTNVSTPYFIDIPPSLLTYFAIDPGSAGHLIAIDPDASIEDFPEYKSFILLTRTSFVTIDRDSHRGNRTMNESLGSYRVLKYSTSKEPLEVTREVYDAVVGYIVSNFVFVKPALVCLIAVLFLIFPFIAALTWLTGLLIWFLFTSLVLLLIVYFTRRAMTYVSLYVYSFYAASGAVLFSTFTGLFGLSIPFVSTIILCTTLIFVILRSPKKSP